MSRSPALLEASLDPEKWLGSPCPGAYQSLTWTSGGTGEGSLSSAGTNVWRNHQHCSHCSGCRRVWLMLLEMQRGRLAESAEAGRGNLQTQTQGSGAGAAVPRCSLSRVQGYPQDGRRWWMKKDRDRDKERMIRREQASVSEACFTLFSSGLLYPELYIQQGEKCRVNSTFHQY